MSTENRLRIGSIVKLNQGSDSGFYGRVCAITVEYHEFVDIESPFVWFHVELFGFSDKHALLYPMFESLGFVDTDIGAARRVAVLIRENLDKQDAIEGLIA